MRTEREKNQAYLEGLKRTISEMPPVEKAAATVMVTLGNTVAALITRHDWGLITEMAAVSSDIFKQAWLVQQEENRRQVQ